jgi:hypothetical protein
MALRREGFSMVSQRTGPSSRTPNMSRTLPVHRMASPYDQVMGFNPFRKQRTTMVDLAMVAGTILIAVALVLWAATG